MPTTYLWLLSIFEQIGGLKPLKNYDSSVTQFENIEVEF